MDATLPIGDFARATHLSVKTLRYYHRVGLLEPNEVDRHTGHRHYTTAQIPTAQIIRRFRALDMPVEQVAQVLAAPDLETRNTLIAAHLNQMEQQLTHAQNAVTSLRDLLTRPPGGTRADIGRRSVPTTPAAAITETVDVTEALTWYQGALGEIYAMLDAQGLASEGPAGGIFSTDLFTHERGPATIFVPCTGPLRPMGRVDALVIPAVELATIVHRGPHSNIDLAYGTLGAYVAEHALAVDGPIREYYPVGRRESSDTAQWRTEICWPIFHTGPAPDPHAPTVANDDR
ncbi:MerR family transcriptional regulator [Streptacidiphilus pinicola]|uniref:MerR family transcriptional regulator n=1 Tax=Streptacidiphilus pinicola TaxID=2219663 RepID=A0A2X0IWA1_9ACTN|nr:MerR family transcriptional regulator [Streptacidiphilus pinicola]RAG81966.1 MerR family transcriptional regulator [Streptacidiphilus pinicola]